MPQIIIEQPGVSPMTVAVQGGEMVLGRADDCDVVLIADEVSRRHAKLIRRDNQVILRDLNSLNGAYVNRERIVERVLTHMDEIWFGSKCRMVYREDTAISAGGPGQAPSHSDSTLGLSIDRIREEMDQVGSNLTMIGQRTPQSWKGVKTPSPAATHEELVKMARAYRRLSAIHQASMIMVENFDLDKRLSNVLDMVMEVMSADRGFVMLRDAGGRHLNVRVAREMGRDLDASSPSMGIAGRAAIEGDPVLMADQEEDEEFGGRDSIIRHQIRSAMCVPLKVDNRVLGSIYIDTRKPDVRFNEEDLELFSALASQSAMAIDNVLLHEQVVEAEKKRQNFGRFLSPAIVQKIMEEEQEVVLGGQKAFVTTMFCDIRGSSRFAESLSAHDLVELLNEHFSAMTEIIFHFQGTLDKYIGDEIMAVFGAPLATGDDPYKAVCAALRIQQLNFELNAIRGREGRPCVDLGIGIDSGEVIAGYIGSPMRMEFTVVGDRVNTAKRFCDMAESGKIVIGQQTWESVKERVDVQPIGTIMLKGKEQPVHAYEVKGLRQPAPTRV